MAKNLFVGNLVYGAEEQALQQLFEQYGPVQSVNIIKDRYSGKSRGFGFVEMVNEEDAQKAIAALNGFDMEGRPLVVKEALPRPERGPNDRPGGDRGGDRRGGFRSDRRDH